MRGSSAWWPGAAGTREGPRGEGRPWTASGPDRAGTSRACAARRRMPGPCSGCGWLPAGASRGTRPVRPGSRVAWRGHLTSYREDGASARLLARDLDADLLGRLGPDLRNADDDDAVLRVRLGLLEAAVGRERDAAQVLDVVDLLVQVLALGHPAAGPDGEHAVLRAELDVVGRDPWQARLDH